MHGVGVWKVKLLSIMLEVEFKKLKTVYRLKKDIKGYHVQLWSSCNSPMDKSYDGYTVGRDLCMVWRGRLKS